MIVENKDKERKKEEQFKTKHYFHILVQLKKKTTPKPIKNKKIVRVKIKLFFH